MVLRPPLSIVPLCLRFPTYCQGEGRGPSRPAPHTGSNCLPVFSSTVATASRSWPVQHVWQDQLPFVLTVHPFSGSSVSDFSALLIPPSAFCLPDICWHLLPVDVTSPVLSVLVCLSALYSFGLLLVRFGREPNLPWLAGSLFKPSWGAESSSWPYWRLQGQGLHLCLSPKSTLFRKVMEPWLNVGCAQLIPRNGCF